MPHYFNRAMGRIRRAAVELMAPAIDVEAWIRKAAVEPE